MIMESFDELREKIDNDIDRVGGVEAFNNYSCSNELISVWIGDLIDTIEAREVKQKSSKEEINSKNKDISLKPQIIKEKNGKIDDTILKKENTYSSYDIVDMIELSYILSQNEEMRDFDAEIKETDDGSATYGLFVMFCYDKFLFSNCSSIEEFVNYELEDCIQEFKEEYLEIENLKKTDEEEDVL